MKLTPVSKYCSMNPDRYKIISLNEALEGYCWYVRMFREDNPLKYPTDYKQMKSFQEWLDTEI